MPRSLSGSPARKRQRLSSPTYDDQVEDLTQEHLAAFDEIEAKLSQKALLFTTSIVENENNPSLNDNTRGNFDWNSSQPQEPSSSFTGFAFFKASELQDDTENPFHNGFTSTTKLSAPLPAPTVGFTSASTLALVQNHERSPSPDIPTQELDLDSWFQPAPSHATPVFQVAKFSTGSAVVGFSKASNKGIIVPSEESLALAKARLDAWNREEEAKLKASDSDEATKSQISHTADTSTGFKIASNFSGFPQQSSRLAFSSVSNILNSPSTPSPAEISRQSLKSAEAQASSSSNNMYRPKQFKPPMLRQPHTPNHATTGSPLNPNRLVSSLGFTSAASQNLHPLAAPPITALPMTPQQHASSSTAFTTPLRKVQPLVTNRTKPAPFKTPFKPGMGPSEAGRMNLGEPGNGRASTNPKVATPVKPTDNWITKERPPRVKPARKSFFCLTSKTERKTLSQSGLRPQQYEVEEFEYIGIDIAMLNQITPETAMYYSFHTDASTPPPSTFSAPSTILGPTEALKELLAHGCVLATKPWVDNHWSLILWKLAGMVALEPEKEAKPDETRWCWKEVMRQLLYRYERELNQGSRPPLRKIANQDAPAAFPMVLCVSNIFWSPPGITDDGLPIDPHPELEVTDGWYRLRAQVDLPMARAVRKGVIRIGKKLGFAGARLQTEKKDATEILEAYNSNKLILSGNSSHLMPWHTKLGFMMGPCISTLNSLTSDGGVVTALDFVITQLYPVAFVEFVEDENGNKDRIGPRNEAEELQVNEQWKRRYEVEASKLRVEHEKKNARYDGYIDRLERKAGGHFQMKEDSYPPDNIDSLYDELEYPDTAASVLARITPMEAGWLAIHIRKASEKGRETMNEDIEKELMTICPPRSVRSFRMLIVQDAVTVRRPKNRVAQLTVWDALGLRLDEDDSEGGGGPKFTEGQRYMATNLIPQHLSAWMDCAPGSEVFLSTRRDTRWTKIRTG